MGESSRRSLLPQKSRTKFSSRKTNASTSNNTLPTADRILSLSDGVSSANLDPLPDQQPTPVASGSISIRPADDSKAGKRPLANIGRSFSLKKPQAQEEKTQLGSQRLPTVKPEGPNARTSRIAAPGARETRATGISANHQPALASVSEAPSEPRPAKSSKPAFSTMQQHFTPKKAPKALTSSFLARPSHEQLGTEKASAETANLQAELARLHLLHRSAANVQRAWEESARNHLQMQFDDVVDRHDQLQELSSYEMTLLNYPALRDWSQGVSNVEFADRLQSLSRSLFEVNDCMSLDSRYSNVLSTFVMWFSCVIRIRGSRERADKDVEDEVEFIEELGDGWRAEVASIKRRLATVSRDSNKLGKPGDGLTLARVVRLLRSSTASMLEELESIIAIEAGTMDSESVWISNEVTKVALEVGQRSKDHRRAWHNA